VVGIGSILIKKHSSKIESLPQKLICYMLT